MAIARTKTGSQCRGHDVRYMAGLCKRRVVVSRRHFHDRRPQCLPETDQTFDGRPRGRLGRHDANAFLEEFPAGVSTALLFGAGNRVRSDEDYSLRQSRRERLADRPFDASRVGDQRARSGCPSQRADVADNPIDGRANDDQIRCAGGFGPIGFGGIDKSSIDGRFQIRPGRPHPIRRPLKPRDLRAAAIEHPINPQPTIPIV